MCDTYTVYCCCCPLPSPRCPLKSSKYNIKLFTMSLTGGELLALFMNSKASLQFHMKLGPYIELLSAQISKALPEVGYQSKCYVSCTIWDRYPAQVFSENCHCSFVYRRERTTFLYGFPAHSEVKIIATEEQQHINI